MTRRSPLCSARRWRSISRERSARRNAATGAFALSPDHAEAHGRLAAILLAHGKIADAISHLERASALKPDLFEVQANLGQAYMAAGQAMAAAEALRRALEIRDVAPVRALFAQCVAQVRFAAADADRFRDPLRRALAEGWAPPRELTGACLSLIKKLNGVVQDAAARATAAWPARLAAPELLGATGLAELSRDLLLCALLECDPIPDVGLERLLTNMPLAMLTSAAAGEDCGEDLLGFYAAIARQCFINKRLFGRGGRSRNGAAPARRASMRPSPNGDTCPALWPVVVGAYFPLHSLANAQALLDRSSRDGSWPKALTALLIQQIKEPAEERRIAAAMPALTGVDDEVSRAVRRQYEESPYPRWVAPDAPAPPASPTDPRSAQRLDVLIAGCGTGMSTIELPGTRRARAFSPSI